MAAAARHPGFGLALLVLLCATTYAAGAETSCEPQSATSWSIGGDEYASTSLPTGCERLRLRWAITDNEAHVVTGFAVPTDAWEAAVEDSVIDSRAMPSLLEEQGVKGSVCAYAYNCNATFELGANISYTYVWHRMGLPSTSGGWLTGDVQWREADESAEVGASTLCVSPLPDPVSWRADYSSTEDTYAGPFVLPRGCGAANVTWQVEEGSKMVATGGAMSLSEWMAAREDGDADLASRFKSGSGCKAAANCTTRIEMDADADEPYLYWIANMRQEDAVSGKILIRGIEGDGSVGCRAGCSRASRTLATLCAGFMANATTTEPLTSASVASGGAPLPSDALCADGKADTAMAAVAAELRELCANWQEEVDTTCAAA